MALGSPASAPGWLPGWLPWALVAAALGSSALSLVLPDRLVDLLDRAPIKVLILMASFLLLADLVYHVAMWYVVRSTRRLIGNYMATVTALGGTAMMGTVAIPSLEAAHFEANVEGRANPGEAEVKAQTAGAVKVAKPEPLWTILGMATLFGALFLGILASAGLDVLDRYKPAPTTTAGGA